MHTKTNGFCVPYLVQDTGDKGLGVFARAAIAKGTLVWRHVPGQYVVFDEPAFRAALKDMTQADAAYELTHVFGMKELPNCLIRILDDGVLINHASAANVETNRSAPMGCVLDITSGTYVHDATKALQEDRFALIATRDIEAGEELLNDYGAEVSDPPFYHELCAHYGVHEDYLG